MEIDNNLVYVVKIDGKLHKITGQDIILSLDMEDKNVVVMYDKDSDMSDVEKAMKLVSECIKKV